MVFGDRDLAIVFAKVANIGRRVHFLDFEGRTLARERLHFH